MSISKGSAEWQGDFKTGRGTMTPAHAPPAKYSVASRFEGESSSNPEELVGAALAGCFSMALTVALERAGFRPSGVRTDAEVNLEKQDGGFAITTIALTSTATVPGIEADRFQTIAEETKKGCPVSKALAGVKISLKASVAS